MAAIPATKALITTGDNPAIANAGQGTNASPQSLEELPSFLDQFQEALTGGTDQPEVRGPGPGQLLGKTDFTVPDQFVGKSIRDLVREGANLGTPGLLAEFLKIDENTPFAADQNFIIGDIPGQNFQDTLELSFLNKNFKKNVAGQVSPGTINRLAGFQFLQEEFGVQDLQNGLNFLKAEQRDLEAQLRSTTRDERGKVVPQSVISGRISKQQQLARDNLEFNNRQQQFFADQINTANNTISLYIDLAGLDQQDAVAKYERDFNQNLKVAQLTRQIEVENRNFEADQEQRKIDNARANLSTFTNAALSGNLDISSLSSSQQLELGRLEAQVGLPVGFVSSLKLSPSEKILSISADKTQAWVIGDNGQMQVISTGLRKAGTGGGRGSKGGRGGSNTIGDVEARQLATADAKAGITLGDFMNIYVLQSNLLDPNTALNIYNSNSPFGPAKESEDDLKSLFGVK